MARYVIGDIQGCYEELMLLLEAMSYSPERDQLYLVGDLVNRGPMSLSVLRWLVREQSHVRTVLGNHDLHLLACAAGVAKIRSLDTIADILAAPDCADLLDWLASQPLLMDIGDYLIVHAGILPLWGSDLAFKLAREVEEELTGCRRAHFLKNIYSSNEPRIWDEKKLSLDERQRLTVNILTRMRLVDETGNVAGIKFKGALSAVPAGCYAWFNYPARKIKKKIVCGHWSALGLVIRDDLCIMDTGCVWGGKMTGMCLDDGRIFQVSSKQPLLVR